MLRRLYIHNYRCLENFELRLDNRSSALLIGKNGSGKTAVRKALELLQSIARGAVQISGLIRASDFAFGRRETPIKIQIEVEIEGSRYNYALSIVESTKQPLRQIAIDEESLEVNGQRILNRDASTGLYVDHNSEHKVSYGVTDTVALLTVVQERSLEEPISIFRRWLASIIILAPYPDAIDGMSTGATEYPSVDMRNYAQWLASLLASEPKIYEDIAGYLKEVFPDFISLQATLYGSDFRNLNVRFAMGEGILTLPFSDLSDGEKCQMIASAIAAANKEYGPLLCFWDEPDNYLSLSEVGHFVTALRRAFLNAGQFIATSHNPEAIRAFSDESTFLMHRPDHLSAPRITPVSELEIHGSLVGAIIRGDEEP